MRIDGSVIEITDGLSAELGDSSYYTARHVAKRFGHANPGKDGKSIVVKNVDIFGYPSKCSIMFDGEKFCGVSYTIKASSCKDGNAAPDDAALSILGDILGNLGRAGWCSGEDSQNLEAGDFRISCSIVPKAVSAGESKVVVAVTKR